MKYLHRVAFGPSDIDYFVRDLHQDSWATRRGAGSEKLFPDDQGGLDVKHQTAPSQHGKRPCNNGYPGSTRAASRAAVSMRCPALQTLRYMDRMFKPTHLCMESDDLEAVYSYALPSSNTVKAQDGRQSPPLPYQSEERSSARQHLR